MSSAAVVIGTLRVKDVNDSQPFTVLRSKTLFFSSFFFFFFFFNFVVVVVFLLCGIFVPWNI